MKRILLLAFPLYMFWYGQCLAVIRGEYIVVVPHLPPPEHSLDRVHIDEIFSFTCLHCYRFHQKIGTIRQAFGSKIEITSKPIGWSGQNPGRLFYIGEKMGKGDRIKDRIFKLVFEKDLALIIDQKMILKSVARLEGISREFEDLIDDPMIVRQMRDGKDLAKTAGITKTPSLLIENVIVTSTDIENLFLIINSLLKEPVKKTLHKLQKTKSCHRPTDNIDDNCGSKTN